MVRTTEESKAGAGSQESKEVWELNPGVLQCPVRGDEKELAKETEEEQPEGRSGEPGMLKRRVLRRRK